MPVDKLTRNPPDIHLKSTWLCPYPSTGALPYLSPRVQRCGGDGGRWFGVLTFFAGRTTPWVGAFDSLYLVSPPQQLTRHSSGPGIPGSTGDTHGPLTSTFDQDPELFETVVDTSGITLL
jgi:hypothetical protein